MDKARRTPADLGRYPELDRRLFPEYFEHPTCKCGAELVMLRVQIDWELWARRWVCPARRWFNFWRHTKPLGVI